MDNYTIEREGFHLRVLKRDLRFIADPLQKALRAEVLALAEQRDALRAERSRQDEALLRGLEEREKLAEREHLALVQLTEAQQRAARLEQRLGEERSSRPLYGELIRERDAALKRARELEALVANPETSEQTRRLHEAIAEGARKPLLEEIRDQGERLTAEISRNGDLAGQVAVLQDRLERAERRARLEEAAAVNARARADRAERRADDMLDAEAGIADPVTGPLLGEYAADARLGSELCAILQDHVTAGPDGRGEGAAEVLRRIIRERDEALNEAKVQGQRARAADGLVERLAEVKRERDEWKEKAEWRRQSLVKVLQEQGRLELLLAEITAQDRALAERAAKLLALLDSEEVPTGLRFVIETEAMAGRCETSSFPAEAAWRWLREQVKQQQGQHQGPPEGGA